MKHTPMVVEPITLQGTSVRLEPLKLEHFDALWAVGQDHDLWQWTPYQITTPEKMHTYIRAALNGQELGVALPFVTIEQKTNREVGSTRFGNIDAPNHRVEIGWTWIGQPILLQILMHIVHIHIRASSTDMDSLSDGTAICTQNLTGPKPLAE